MLLVRKIMIVSEAEALPFEQQGAAAKHADLDSLIPLSIIDICSSLMKIMTTRSLFSLRTFSPFLPHIAPLKHLSCGHEWG